MHYGSTEEQIDIAVLTRKLRDLRNEVAEFMSYFSKSGRGWKADVPEQIGDILDKWRARFVPEVAWNVNVAHPARVRGPGMTEEEALSEAKGKIITVATQVRDGS